MESESLNVHREGTRIWFYEDVTSVSGLLLEKELVSAAKEAQHTQLDYGIDPIVTLYINSDGGEVASMFSISDLIIRLPVVVHTVISGHACSAASLIALAGDTRLITSNSEIMIHQPSTWAWGTKDQIKDGAYHINQIYKRMVKFYVERSALSKKQIKKRLKHDWVMNAKQAYKAGFVDGII